MDLVGLSIRTIIGLIFLSSAISKLRNINKHVSIVREYKILPKALIRPFSFLDAFLELLASLCLLLGFKIEMAGTLLLLLIGTYTAGIIINLIRGRTHISCGCGGVVGNHALSWYLPTRNIVLAAGTFYLINIVNPIFSVDAALKSSGNIIISAEDITSTILGSFLMVVVLNNLNSIYTIRKLFREILLIRGGIK